VKLLPPLLLILAGCAPHPRVLLPGTRYRITQLGETPLILTPPVAELPSAKPLEVQFPVSLGPSALTRRNPGAACREGSDLFEVRVDRKTRRLALTMPSLTEWQKRLPEWDQPDRGELEKKIELMLTAPEALQNRGCLSPGSAVELRQLLRESIPTRPGFDLYPAYGYRSAERGLDLKAGVRLKVQRAHFNGAPPEDGKRSIKDLIGVSTVYYEVRTDAQRQRTSFAPPSVQYDSEKVRAALGKSWEDLGFARQAKPQPLYRLFFLTSYPKKGVRRTALVLGAANVAAMESMQRQIAADPSVECGELTRGLGATCLSFDGDASVSAEVLVTVNGVASYLEWGSSVRSVLTKAQVERPGAIGLRRMFEGRLMPVEVDPKLDRLLESTVLVAGDDLVWR